jgi:transcriptional regulator with XRE-family HTH domain
VNIGDRIRITRKTAGLSQEEVARRAGLSLKGMGEIERGDIEDPHISSLAKIARALGVPVEALIKEEEEPAVPLAEDSREAGRLEKERLEADSPKDRAHWERVLASVRERQREVEAIVEELVVLSARGEVDPYQVKWALDEAQDCSLALMLALPGSRREQDKIKLEIDSRTVDVDQLNEWMNAERLYDGILKRLVEADLVVLRERAGQKAEPVPVGIGA